jgi:hypothetical protein
LAEPATLTLAEGVDLAHALVARLAARHGIRVLFVKGPLAVAAGARPPRPSSDVDVLCEPGGLDRLGPALVSLGWRHRAPDVSVHHLEHAAGYLFEHSEHFIHDDWPCDLDVHFSFPGFLAPPGEVFEALWRRRTSQSLAGVEVATCDLLGHAAVVALHALRDPRRPRSLDDLRHLESVLRARLDDPGLAELTRLAEDTGAAETLRPLLDLVGAPAPLHSTTDRSALAQWEFRISHGDVPATAWLLELRAAPWRRRVAVVRRAVLLPTAELMGQHVGARPTWWMLGRLQAQRWLRALPAMPRAVALVWRETRRSRGG